MGGVPLFTEVNKAAVKPCKNTVLIAERRSIALTGTITTNTAIFPLGYISFGQLHFR